MVFDSKLTISNDFRKRDRETDPKQTARLSPLTVYETGAEKGR